VTLAERHPELPPPFASRSPIDRIRPPTREGDDAGRKSRPFPFGNRWPSGCHSKIIVRAAIRDEIELALGAGGAIEDDASQPHQIVVAFSSLGLRLKRASPA
jgi:hypothetical protein